MRNINRIQKFCDQLAAMWRTVPDWRFGQLISNVLGEYVAQTHRDIFFPEDDEMLKFFAEYFSKMSGYVEKKEELPQNCAYCYDFVASPRSPLCGKNGHSLKDVMINERPDWCPRSEKGGE